VIGIDGLFHKVDLSDFSDKIHAVQFEGAVGHIEFVTGANQKITDIAPYQGWLDRWEVANTPLPVVPPSPEQTRASLVTALDDHIDSVARAKGYDSRITAALRAGYLSPWQAEGTAFGQWMDACYYKAYGIEASGVIPTKEELIAAMPVMVWPL
jgi:hypothetical protein